MKRVITEGLEKNPFDSVSRRVHNKPKQKYPLQRMVTLYLYSNRNSDARYGVVMIPFWMIFPANPMVETERDHFDLDGVVHDRFHGELVRGVAGEEPGDRVPAATHLEHRVAPLGRFELKLTSARRASLGFLGLNGPCFFACST